MREFRKKQKRLKKIMNTVIIISAVILFLFIGVQPFIVKAFGSLVAIICSYVMDILIIASLIVLFTYYSKYGKSDKFLESVENELSDNGFYYTSRQENELIEFTKSVVNDLRETSFSVNENITINDFDFNSSAIKKNQFFYIVNVDDVDKNDVLAYLDAVMFDITANNLKRKGDGVLLFVTNKANDDAVALSKMITPVGKKEQLKIAIAIVEVPTKRCYFLGNMPTKGQQLVVNYAMKCDLPIKPEFIGDKRIKCQDELEQHMKDFNIKSFKDGTFYAH